MGCFWILLHLFGWLAPPANLLTILLSSYYQVSLGAGDVQGGPAVVVGGRHVYVGVVVVEPVGE